jgi:oligoribonuclease NrnB/cAMP/cGMP phosphodiesterase (DHH superfamily)
MDIIEKVLLLAILKKESNETLNDVVLTLENTNLFSLKEGKRLLKKLKSEEYISDSYLTFKGEAVAKNVEQEFKL